MKLKIALWNNLPSGGGKRAFYELANGLKKRGHQLESWCPPTANREYLPLGNLITENVVDYEIISYKPKRKWEVLMHNTLKFQKQLAAMEDHCRKCADEINAGNFDVLFCGNCWSFAVPPIAKYIKCPKVIYHQEPKRSLHEARPRLPWVAKAKEHYEIRSYSKLRQIISDHENVFSKRLELREEVNSLEAFDLILVNSAFSRENILRSFNIDSKVCYLGINTDVFMPLGLEKENFVIGLGGLQSHKGIDLAIKAISYVPREIRPRLLWVGNIVDEKYQQQIQKEANKVGVSFESLVFITDKQLVELLNKAALFIYTSHLEPFGFAPLEANACGTAVVAVAEGGVRETIQSGVNGILVPDRNPNALGKEIELLIQNKNLTKNMGDHGISLVKNKWTWDASVDRVESELQGLLGI
jgi:glycosyltransferase involved in cell wall biosynthesis